MGEFDLKRGSLGPGLRSLFLSAMLYMVLPFVLILLYSMIATGMSSDGSWDRPMLQAASLVLIFGLFVSVAAFFNGYYQKGTRSRLAFGLLTALLAVLYCYALFLGGPFEKELDLWTVAGAFPLQMFALGVLWQVALAPRHLCAYKAHRQDWLRSEGMEGARKAPSSRTLGSEFGLAHGDLCIAATEARSTTLRFALLPSALVLALWLVVSSASPQASPGREAFLDALSAMAWTMMLFGFLMAPISWSVGAYPKGTASRLSFGLFLSLVLALDLWWALVGSRLDAGLSGLDLDIDLGLVLGMLLLLVAMMVLRFVGEVVDGRRKWKRSIGIKVEERRRDPEHWSMDLHPAIGSMEAGAKMAQSSLLKFIVLPIILIVVGVALLENLGGETLSSFAGVLGQEGPVVILWGLPLVGLGFARGLYPLGSLGRMAFGLVGVLFLALYVFALLLGGSLEQWVRDRGLPLDLDQVWLALLVPIAFRGLMQVAETADHRRRWKRSIGRKVPEVVEEGRHSPWLDFRARYGRYVPGTKEAKVAANRYLVFPIILVLVLGAVLSALSGWEGMEQLPFLAERLEVVYGALLLFALPLVLLCFFRGFYPKGSYSRLTFGWAVAILLALWIWMVTMGGRLGTALDAQQMGIGVDLDLSGLVLVFMALELIWGIYYLAEFLSYRKDWVANHYHPVEDRPSRRRRERALDQAGQ